MNIEEKVFTEIFNASHTIRQIYETFFSNVYFEHRRTFRISYTKFIKTRHSFDLKYTLMMVMCRKKKTVFDKTA